MITSHAGYAGGHAQGRGLCTMGKAMHNRGARTRLEQGRSPQAVIQSEAKGTERRREGKEVERGRKEKRGKGGEERREC